MKQPRTLVIEGWRSVPNSYAIVNSFQCLQFLQEPNLALRHVDLPYLYPNWKPTTGLFSPAEEAAIGGIPAPAAGEIADAVFRISYPYNISRSAGRRTVVFATAELRCVPNEFIAANRSLASACDECDAVIVTPSNWSREGFIHSGAPPERVKVVPHGIDVSLFHPVSPEEQAAMRTTLNWNGFVFLSVGSMTDSKGIAPLLKAFAIVAQRHPNVRLVLKGLGALYSSRAYLQEQAKGLTQAELAVVQPRLMYLDQTMSFAEMARLYQSADAYVSPYVAEAFNMPVLEAVASGLPVICTRGGCTDDFTTDDFALRVNSIRVPQQKGTGAVGTALGLDFNHLVHQMMMAVASRSFAQKARIGGPAFVAAGYTWRDVSSTLLAILLGIDSNQNQTL
jgi:glycosyltransferase involved in cell wall biosynthesis